MEEQQPEMSLSEDGAQDVLHEFDELVQLAAQGQSGDGESNDFSAKVIELVNGFYRDVSATEEIARERWQRAAMFVSAATIYASTLQGKFAKAQGVLQQALAWGAQTSPDEVPSWARDAEELLPEWLDQND